MGAAVDVSVVIPTYNRLQTIVEAIESVRAQGDEVEIVVVDDGSTDDTAERLAQRFGTCVRVERLPCNQGVSAARNHGWRTARGSLVAFLDSDDVWLPGALSALRAPFADPRTLAVHGIVGHMNEAGFLLARKSAMQSRFYADALRRGYDYAGITAMWPRIYPSGLMLRRDLLDRTGGFDERMRIFED